MGITNAFFPRVATPIRQLLTTDQVHERQAEKPERQPTMGKMESEGWKGIEKRIGALRSNKWPEAMRLSED